jgi:hypothetical protein
MLFWLRLDSAEEGRAQSVRGVSDEQEGEALADRRGAARGRGDHLRREPGGEAASSRDPGAEDRLRVQLQKRFECALKQAQAFATLALVAEQTDRLLQ